MKRKIIIITALIVGLIIVLIIIQHCHVKKPQKQEIQTVSTYTTNIPSLEIPCTNDTIISHTHFALGYSEAHEQAFWVAYILTNSNESKSAERSKSFSEDPKVLTGSASNKDYYKSGYDKGHLAPAADMKHAEIAMKESFYLSNVSPQIPEFNRGIWKKLEETIRIWSVLYDTVHIVTGPILENGLPYIGINKVSVPNYFYKAILVYTEKNKKAIGFILPNQKSQAPLQTFAVSIDEIESKINRNLFCKLPKEIEDSLEKQIHLEVWKWN